MCYFCTYFDSNYLYKGIAMYRSLLQSSNNFKLWILCLDELTYKLLMKMDLKNVELIPSEDFEDEDLLKAKKNRSSVEYFWTCTPSLPLYIMKKYSELSMITYIDADLYFYSDPSLLFEQFNGKSIQLIEHRYAKDIESNIKKYGRYNVQFITFRNDAIGLNALKWWRDKCLEWCYIRAEKGKYGDQKYLDDWKDRFPGFHEIKLKGAGLAPWNITNHKIKQVGNKIFVDDDELIFYHFHFFKIYSKRMFSLSHYKLSKDYKNIIYIPYIKSIIETIGLVREYDINFNKGYSLNRLSRIKDVLWILVSLIRGNFMRYK